MIRTWVVMAIAVATGAACGGAGEATTFGADDAWSRPTPSGATTGVLYLTVTSDVDDELVAVDVPAAVAASASLHTTEIEAEGGHHGHGGQATMEHSDSFEVGPDATLVLAPGGRHVMLNDLVTPLQRDDSFSITLRFDSGRTLDVEVLVADNPPS